ncbi:hypothetical protein HUW48_04925 [Adhaeribacter radiodurans]|uniref:Uncharacterized protein n=1 Tax=Adhaeribacter radiodurans TaxID=2745197 RepID=A0A7L7L4W0_9BACT|nr:hypothetical protein HUW48_04925 [Adhaeribacter radiodurans]
MPLFILIDRVSTIIGGFIVAVVILKLQSSYLPHQHNINNNNNKYWLCAGMLIFLIMTLRLLLGVDSKYFILDVLITLISASLWSLFITPYVIMAYKN